MTKNTVVVASVSARPYVQSLSEAGYQVIAIDCFKDVEIQCIAKQSYYLTLNNGGFDGVGLERILRQIDWQSVMGFVYGSGFDAAPDLLDLVATYTVILGNTSEVCKKLKSAPSFFDLMRSLGIVFPAVCYQALTDAHDWLEKRIDGAGGVHIHAASVGITPKQNFYYQKRCDGIPVSVLFLADGKRAKIVGFNRLYIDGDAHTPYRFGGAVSNIVLPSIVQKKFAAYVGAITQAVGLRGLNSLDAILLDDELYVLEINPRLSATIALYQPFSTDRQQSVLAWHIAAAQGNMPEVSVFPHAMAQRIIYAIEDVDIDANIEWPAWVSDIPATGSNIKIGAPICSVTASADSSEAAEALVTARSESLRQLVNK